MACEYVRQAYNVPADIGVRVVVNGKPGIIAADRGNYIGVNFDSDKPGAIKNCHPTWEVQYGEIGVIRNGSMTFLGKPPQAQRAYDKVKDACTAQGLANDKDVAYALGVLGTKARQANARAPKLEKRKMVRKTLKAAGEIGKTKSDWMREADKWFSRFIRLRDTHDNSNGPRSGRCVTCGDHRIIADLDCGHWIRREHWGTRYSEANCHAQCSYKCNNLGGGKEREHEAAIEKIHGVGIALKLLYHSKNYKRKPTAKEFQAIAEKYEKKVSDLGGWPDK